MLWSARTIPFLVPHERQYCKPPGASFMCENRNYFSQTRFFSILTSQEQWWEIWWAIEFCNKTVKAVDEGNKPMLSSNALPESARTAQGIGALYSICTGSLTQLTDEGKTWKCLITHIRVSQPFVRALYICQLPSQNKLVILIKEVQ